MENIDTNTIAAAAAVITALCTGVAGIIAGVAGFVVAWRNSQSTATKEKAEAQRLQLQSKTEDRKADLVIRKDELDLLRGELARQYSVIERVEAEAEDWRKKNSASQEHAIDLTRQLENANDGLAEQQKKLQEAEEIIAFVVDRERTLRKTLAEHGIPIPPMRRRMDEKLANGFNAKLGLVDALGDKADTGPLKPPENAS